MRAVPLVIPFLIALLFTLFSTALFPQIKFIGFSPFLALLYHRCGFLKALWGATLCGLLVDLCNSELRFGAYALNFCAVTALLYRYRRHFFEDKAISLVLFTAIISFLSSLIHLSFLKMQGNLPFSLRALSKDLVMTSFFDGVYAFCAFSCPFLLYKIVRLKCIKR